MEFMAMLIKIVSLISEACRNAEKLLVALMSAGVFQAAAALALAFFKAPLVLHGRRAPVYLYYGVLIATVIFVMVEAYAGFWVSGDLTARQAVGKTIMWISMWTSILPVVLVAGLGLGGFVVLK